MSHCVCVTLQRLLSGCWLVKRTWSQRWRLRLERPWDAGTACDVHGWCCWATVCWVEPASLMTHTHRTTPLNTPHHTTHTVTSNTPTTHSKVKGWRKPRPPLPGSSACMSWITQSYLPPRTLTPSIVTAGTQFVHQLRMKGWVDLSRCRYTTCPELLQKCWPAVPGVSWLSWLHSVGKFTALTCIRSVYCRSHNKHSPATLRVWKYEPKLKLFY